jgi:AcrR family transcriptional regulator
MKQRPKPKGTKRDRTRSLLIEAAAEVIAAKGLDRTALEDVARRAGMTRGAIYGNFKNKEELFLAVAATRWQPIISSPPPGSTLRERMVTHGKAVAAAAPARRADAVGATSFVQYALTHEHLRKLVTATNAQIYMMAAARLTGSASSDQLPAPAEQFVRVVHALTEGLLILHARSYNIPPPHSSTCVDD